MDTRNTLATMFWLSNRGVWATLTVSLAVLVFFAYDSLDSKKHFHDPEDGWLLGDLQELWKNGSGTPLEMRRHVDQLRDLLAVGPVVRKEKTILSCHPESALLLGEYQSDHLDLLWNTHRHVQRDVLFSYSSSNTILSQWEYRVLPATITSSTKLMFSRRDWSRSIVELGRIVWSIDTKLPASHRLRQDKKKKWF